MPHFASRFWPKDFGPVASLSVTGVTNVYGSGDDTTVGSTEGTDLLTYSVLDSGMYRITGQIHNLLDSVPGTTHFATLQITYNNGSAVTVQDLGAIKGGGINTQAGVNMETDDNQGGQTGFVYAVAGTDITCAVQHVVTGTVPTLGTHNIDMCIEKIG